MIKGKKLKEQSQFACIVIICIGQEYYGFTCVGILTWLKLSRALCKLASIPVGGSLVILIEDSSIPYTNKEHHM